MILDTFARLGYFFRPFRRGAYRHAPSIEEMYTMRHGSRSPIARWCKKYLPMATDSRRR